MFRLIAALAFAAASILPLSSHAEDTLKLGYSKCAHCTAMSLVPENTVGVKVEGIGFNTGNDVLTALVSKSIDVAQVTYLHLVTALDRGFDIVAISGQISGGSQMLIGNTIPVKPNDWDALKKLIMQYKASGKLFRVAASRGNAQDIHMRGEFAKHGIDVNKDVQFINIPNPSDHLQALRRNEVELIATTEPFATQILQLKGAKFFDYPYDQAAGRLTNLIVTRSDVIANKPKEVEAVVRATLKVNDLMAANKQLFIDTISKVSGLDKAIATGSVDNLYPDSKLYRTEAIAIAKMMRDLKYVNSDVSGTMEKHMDYRFLEAVTGKPKTELGY